MYREEPLITGIEAARTALVTVSPGVVHHPPVLVDLRGAPGLARVAVEAGALAEGLVPVNEWKYAGSPGVSDSFTRLCK